MDINTLFQERFNEILNKYHGEKAAIFFRGFTPLQNKTILSCTDSLISVDITMDNEYLNIPSIISAKKMMVGQLSFTDRKLVVGVYEQLVAISGAVSNINDLYDGKIIIVDNNLFDGYYPSCIPLNIAKEVFEYYQQEDKDTPEQLIPYVDCYGDVISLDGNKYFTSIIDKHTDEKYITIPFFKKAESVLSKEMEISELISISDLNFVGHIADILYGEYSPTTYIIDTNDAKIRNRFYILADILNNLGVPYSVRPYNRFDTTDISDDNKYLSLLHEYWGSDVSFRTLKFYKNPEFTNETIGISQGNIISKILQQSEKALSGNHDFNNIFITAPTGAGKSLLFQIPAIHLAKNYKAVTVVVTPLIALMKDQVTQLEEQHHISFATFLNSTISFEEREKRINAIKDGRISIIYMAPEMLISNQLDNIIGNRPVGLFVIDEAHIVTSWGKDFRADYWYLGDFLTKLRRSNIWFPVLCLTATAVYGGPEDVVNETIESLSLDKPLIYLGNVRRDNIKFDIHHIDRKSVVGGIEEYKVKNTVERIQSFVGKQKKSLVYCPFTSQVDDVYEGLDNSIKTKVTKYHGSLNKIERDMAQNRFNSNDCDVMICTKAFGMGVDIKSIQNIYHYAPTGNLADYVQEIGRAARKKEVEGHAIADFLSSDMRYVRMLYGISEMKQYQLKEMIRKLYDIYREKGHRNMLISPDAFSYLFEEKDLENKVKSGLLLISKDLAETYGFPVINVRPKAMFTKNYVNVPDSTENEFVKRYGRYARLLDDNTKRIIPTKNSRYASDTIVTNSGNIYEVDMANIWETHFENMSFMQFKYLFFKGELFDCGDDEKLSPRIHITINYESDFSDTIEKFKTYISGLSGVFQKYKLAGKIFTAEEFKRDLISALGDKFKRFEFAGMLLDLFVADISQNIAFNVNSDKLKFVASKKSAAGDSLTYRIMNSNYITLNNYFTQMLGQCVPDDENVYRSFIPLNSNGKRPEKMNLLSILELFGLATYEVNGGQNIEIFVRINDPIKIKRLSLGNYTNNLLTQIKHRHKISQTVMTQFFEKDFSDEQRWNIIENYFLGREEYVNQILNS